MRVPYSWLKEYVSSDLPAEEVAEKLTMAGVAVESIDLPVPGLEKIVAGRILEISQHPQSKKLKVCKIDTGNKILQVISSAPNLEVGSVVPIALPGVSLPGGIAVEIQEILGLSSEGMLCSGAELEVDEWGFGNDKGILILDQDVAPGSRIDEALHLNDQILDFDLTPNRGDCLSVINIAREIKALTGSEFSFPSTDVTEDSGKKVSEYIQVEIQEPDLCRRYAGRVIKDVKIAPSPLWLQYRLRASGVRPINNVVDVTNYVMLELGQPLHAFDYDRLRGSRIIVRRAEKDEHFLALDGSSKRLESNMLAIADAEGAVALAGVMGGMASEVTAATKTIFLESAYFDPLSIRLTSKAVGLRTESSQRFEKGINIAGVIAAVNRAAHLIANLGAGQVVSGVIDKYPRPQAPLAIRLRIDRLNLVLGTNLEMSEVQEIFQRLDFPCELCGPGSLLVSVPPYRVDISQEVDLIEEVARIYGYEHIPATMPSGILARGSGNATNNGFTKIVKWLMVECGLDEAITLSFTGNCAYDRLRIAEDSSFRQAVRIQNPLRDEQGMLRTLILPGLIDVVAANCKRNLTNLAFFEIGATFKPLEEEKQPQECRHLAIAVCGKEEYGWHAEPIDRDFYYVKGIVEELFKKMSIDNVVFQALNDLPALHPGRSARILYDGQELGFIGDLHPDVLMNWGLPLPVTVCEIDLEAVIAAAKLDKRVLILPRYPGIYRDLAIVVAKEVAADEVMKAIKEAGGELLRSCKLFDVYEGSQVAPGCKSLAYSLFFQSLEGTLTDDEITLLHQKIVENLEKKVGAKLR